MVLLLGDGAAGFSLMDVDTLVRHDLPVVMVMGNNSAWGLEKGPMQMLYGYDVVADLAPRTPYDEVVKALGGAGETVTDPRQIGAGARPRVRGERAVPRQRDHRRRRGLPAQHVRDLSLRAVKLRRATRWDYAIAGELTVEAYADVHDRPTRPLHRAPARRRDAATARRSSGWRRPTTATTWCSAPSPSARPGRRGARSRGEDEGEFRMLAVAPAARGRGVGEALVRLCLDRFRADGCRARSCISTLAEMTAAHRLYERLGFVRDARAGLAARARAST